MTGKEGGSQKKIATTIMNIRKSWHAIICWNAVQPPLSGHSHLLAIPKRVVFVVTYIKQPCIKRLMHLFWVCFKNKMNENIVQDRRWRVWAHGVWIMALEWLGWNDSRNYPATVSLHFVLFCFLFACCFVTCPWLEHHLKGFSTETTFRSITFFAKIV